MADKESKESTDRNSDELAKVQKKITGLVSKLTDFTVIAGQLFTGISDAAGSLAQSNRISSQGINQFTGQVKDSSISFSKNIANYSNLVSQGLGREALELGSLNETMTLFGVNVAAGNRLTRLNAQALGLSTSQAASLTRATIETAIEYGVGVDAMVNALNQMSSTLIKVGVEFGKDAAVGLESATAKLIGKVGQEFAGTATKFAGQLFTGLDGLQRRAFLGIQGQELTPEALTKALSKLTSLKEQAGGTGTGVTAFVEAMQQQFGFGADIFALADAIANPTVKSETQIEQLEQQAKLNNALTSLNKIANSILMYVAPLAVSFSNSIASLLTPLKLILKGVLIIKLAQFAQQAVQTARHGTQKAMEVTKIKLLTKIAMRDGVGAAAALVPGVLKRFGSFVSPLILAAAAINSLPSILGKNSDKEQETAAAINSLPSILGKNSDKEQEIAQPQPPLAVSFSNSIASLLTPLNLIALGIVGIKVWSALASVRDKAMNTWTKSNNTLKVSLLRKIAMKTGSGPGQVFGGVGKLAGLLRFLPVVGTLATLVAVPAILSSMKAETTEIAQAQLDEQKKTNGLLTEDIVKRTQTDALLAVKAQSAAMLLRLDSITESSRRTMEDGTRRTRIGEETQDLLKSNSTGIDFMTD
jgi:hypothetical protein